MWTAVGGVLLALLVAGVGIPLPEDLTLLGAGYLAWRGEAPLGLMLLVGVVGITVGDSSLYWIGRKLGPRVTRHPWLAHALTAARLERLERFFRRHGSKVVLLARFAAGARGALYLTAGTMRLSYRRFVVFDLVASTLSVAFWVLLGWHFGDHIHAVRHLAVRAEHVALAVALLLGAPWVLARLGRRLIEGPAEPRNTAA